MADRAFACDRCFEDAELIEWIRDKGKPGRCAWCGSRKAYIVPLTSLSEPFRNAAALYGESEDEHGEFLGNLLQQQWGTFSERIEARGLTQELTLAILTADLTGKEMSEGPDYSSLFDAFDFEESNLEENWRDRLEKPSQLPESISKKDRALLSEAEEETKKSVEEYLTFAISDVGLTYSEGQILYRARLHTCRMRPTRFSPAEMGAPPDGAIPGRANREGQRVLYMASDQETALAEKRAWKGAALAVAKMKLTKELDVLDLRQVDDPSGPFFEDTWLGESTQTNCSAGSPRNWLGR